MNHWTTYLVATALALPLVLYVATAMRTPRSKVSTSADYFVAVRQVGASPFSNSSLAYAFQVATLFPFLYWGVRGQYLPAIVNAIAWGIGILLFRRSLPAIMARLNSSATPKTLHGLLGTTYSSLGVQRISAWVTIVGMIGMAISEAYWGMQIISVIVPVDTPAFYAVVLGTLLFVLAYVWYAGAWGSMKTDMWQMIFSYLGFSVVFFFALGSIVLSRSILPSGATAICLLMFLGGISSVALRLKKRIQPLSPMSPAGPPQRGSEGVSKFTLIELTFLAVSFGWLMFRSLPSEHLSSLTNPGDPKWLGILALAMMPLGFQFVDMSAWQRLQTIGGTRDEVNHRARRGLLVFMIESPFSWIMCVALGMLLVAVMPQLATIDDKSGPLAAIPRLLISSGSGVGLVVAIAFMIAVMAIMLSTIDSLLVSVMYTFVADVRNCDLAVIAASDSSIVDRKKDQVNLLSGKKTAYWVIICVSAAVVGLGWTLQSPEKLIGILVGFYGAMLSLLPATLMMLSRKWRASGESVTAGIAVGTSAALGFTIWGLFDTDKAWYAVLAAPIIAAMVTLFVEALLRCLGRKRWSR